VWTVNGAQARQGDVSKLVRDHFSIQLDNLCQFLPQDRVSEFARLTPAALLVETQRASGDGLGLCAAHREAANRSSLSYAEDLRAAALRGELAAAARQQEAVRGDAERLQQREGHTRRAQLARTKEKLLRADRCDAEVERTRAMIGAANRTIAANEAALGRGGGQGPVNGEELEQLAGELSRASKTATDRAKDARKTLEKQVNKVEEAVCRVDVARNKLAAVPAMEAARARDLRGAEQRFAEAEATLNAILLEGSSGGDSSLGGSFASSHGNSQALEQAKDKVEELARELRTVRVAKDGKVAEFHVACADFNEANAALRKAKRENNATGAEKARRARFLRVLRLLNEVEMLRSRERLYKGAVFGPVGAEIEIKESARERAAVRAGRRDGDENGDDDGGRNDENGEAASAAVAAEAASVVARMLESFVPLGVLNQFVVTHEEDQSRIMDLARGVQEASAVAQVQPGGVLLNGVGLRPKIKMTTELRELGVECTLGDIIDAPAEIKRVLEDEAGVDSATVVTFRRGGRAPSLANVRRVCPAVKALVTPEGIQRCLTSRYNRAASTTTVEPLRSRSLLFEDSEGARAKARAVQETVRAVAEAERIKDKLYAECAELETQETAVQAALRVAGNELQRLKGRREKAEEEVRNAQIAVTVLRNKPSVEAQAAQHRQELAAAAAAAQELAALAARTARELHELNGAAAATAALAAETQARSRALAEVTRLHRVQLKSAKATRKLLEGRLVKEERAAAAAYAAVGDFAPGGVSDPADFDDETRAALAALPGELYALQRVVDDAEAAAAGISAADSDALRRFRERGAAVARLRAEADSADAAAERAAAAAAEAREKWLPRARELIETVGAEFAAAMRRLGCDGDATLVEGDDGDDENGNGAAAASTGNPTSRRRPPNPNEASVRLRVRFREGERLQTLDGSRQSGGERSVATILYLVALQRVASAPFRVVDEINQGMDPTNERAVFGVLAEAAGAAGTPQCFLLTPKLLPDLPYSDSVTVLQVVNGPIAREAVEGGVTAARMLKGRRMLGGGGGSGGGRVAARG